MNQVKKLALLFLLAGSVFLLASSTSSLYALSSSLKQQILPQNCIFQTVNDGTGTLFYVTPEECGVIIPPVVSSRPTISPVLTPPVNTGPSQDTDSGPGPTINFGYPWQPIASSHLNHDATTTGNTDKPSSPPSLPPAAAVFVTAALAIIIIILIL